MARAKSLVLILSRELAANLATPMLLIDQDGTLVYHNEAADQLLGKRFDEVGEIPVADLAAMFSPRDDEGRVLRRHETPPGIAFFEHRPAHRVFWLTSHDGVERRVAVTAYPLWSKADQFAGVVAILWDAPEGGEG
jgi:PAS domain S-box-containing protein